MKFKTILFSINCVFVTVSGCKKDDTSPGGGGNLLATESISPMQPPPGFIFPKTYYQRQNTSDFHVWISNVDKTNLFTPQYFFKDPLTIIDFNLKLNSITSLEIIDPSGKYPTDKYNYYFYRDTLFIINIPIPDTLPLGSGNFNSFVISNFHFFIAGSNNAGSSSKVSGSGVFVSNKDALITKYASWFSQIDTLALYNNSITFK